MQKSEQEGASNKDSLPGFTPMPTPEGKNSPRNEKEHILSHILAEN